MENKVKNPAALTALTVVAVVISIALYILRAAVGENSPGFIFMLITFFLAAVCALNYTCLGSTKDTFLFFRICCISYALYKFATILSIGSFGATAVLALNALCLVFLTILGTAQNLGKKLSLLFAFLNLAATLAGLVINIVNSWALSSALGGAVFAMAFVCMVFAKYINKAQRGTK